jgi:glycosyltransferase involved in cell wall biosynthesis
LRLAVVSPFLDRQHGTELCLVEQIERLASLDHWQIHLYSQRVEQLEGVRVSEKSIEKDVDGIFWHKISDISGPHLLKYCWWFIANQFQRWRDKQSGEANTDLTYTAGINCLDADVIMIQIVFHEFYGRVKSQLAIHQLPLRTWPLILHRKLYYKLIMSLERRIYRDSRVRLIAISSHVATQMTAHFGRTDMTIVPSSTDTRRFNPGVRKDRRNDSRKRLGFSIQDFVILFIGNDWKNKGLDALLRGCAELKEIPWRLLVVGHDDVNLYKPLLEQYEMQSRVIFEKPSVDVASFYAAADLYISPSLEDAFGLPILEAMACGLPVIASIHAGASENIQDGQNGVLLKDPRNPAEIAQKIKMLLASSDLREKLGEAAARFAQENCSWEQNARKTREVLEESFKNLSQKQGRI